MSEFTKGPWHTYKDADGNFRLRNEDNRSVGLIWEEPDAHLVASAPELYEALKEALDMAMAYAPESKLEPVVEQCEKAIAKAEGRTL